MVRVLRLAAILWLTAITTRYLDTVRKSLLNPFNPGADLVSAAVVLVFVAVIVGSLVWNRDYATRTWVAVLIAAVIAIILLSGSFIPAAIALWIVAAGTFLGDWILVKLGLASREDLCERFVIAFPVGIIVFASLTFTLALLGIFHSAVVWSVLILLTLAELPHASRVIREFGTRISPQENVLLQIQESRFLILLAGFAVVRNLTWAVAPEVEFDTLNFRLAVPKIFLTEGRFVDLPYIWHSYFTHLLEYLHGFGMALHSEAVAKLVVAMIGIAAAVSVYTLGRRIYSPAVGLWAAVFFYTTPLVSWGTGTAYNDNALAEFLTAAIIALIEWNRSQRHAWIILSGALAGGAVAIKLNAAYAVVPLTLALVFLLAVRGKQVSSGFKTIGFFGTTACLVAAPWYLVVYILTGNPIFPLMNGIFRSPFWEMNNTLMNSADFGIGTSAAALLRLPFRITLETTRFGEALPRGSLGPLLLVFIPFAFLAIRKNREARLLALVVCVYLVLWAYTFQYGRYYTAVLPGIAILACAGLLLVSPGFMERSRRIVLGTLLIAQMAVLPVLQWRIFERFPVYVALGMENRESFLRRAVAGYRAAEFLNTATRPGETIISVGFEEGRFYLKAPLETFVESRIRGTLSAALQMRGEELAMFLLEHNVAYILLSPQDISDPGYSFASAEFLEQYTKLEYSDEFARVFHLKR